MAQQQDLRHAGPGQWASIVAIGAGIGWLIGNSASPVLAGVLTSLLGLTAGIVTGFRSLRATGQAGEPAAWATVDARPAAALMVAIALAATGGLMVKAHRLLEPEVIRDAAWQAARQGRLQELAAVDAHGALLFNVSRRECNALLSLTDNEAAFVGELRHSSLPGAPRLAERIGDPQTLVTVVEALCEKP